MRTCSCCILTFIVSVILIICNNVDVPNLEDSICNLHTTCYWICYCLVLDNRISPEQKCHHPPTTVFVYRTKRDANACKPKNNREEVTIVNSRSIDLTDVILQVADRTSKTLPTFIFLWFCGVSTCRHMGLQLLRQQRRVPVQRGALGAPSVYLCFQCMSCVIKSKPLAPWLPKVQHHFEHVCYCKEPPPDNTKPPGSKTVRICRGIQIL